MQELILNLPVGKLVYPLPPPTAAEEEPAGIPIPAIPLALSTAFAATTRVNYPETDGAKWLMRVARSPGQLQDAVVLSTDIWEGPMRPVVWDLDDIQPGCVASFPNEADFAVLLRSIQWNPNRQVKIRAFANEGNDRAMMHLTALLSCDPIRLRVYASKVRDDSTSRFYHKIHDHAPLVSLELPAVYDKEALFGTPPLWADTIEDIRFRMEEYLNVGMRFPLDPPPLEALTGFPSLKRLAGPFAPDGLQALKTVPSLAELRVVVTSGGRVPLSGAQLSHLQHVPYLTRLDVVGHFDVDATLTEPIGKLRFLASLSLAQTNFGDAGLETLPLGSLPRLKHIDFTDTKVTDDGTVHLRQARSLTSVDFSGTTIRDGTMGVLASMPHVRSVTITNGWLYGSNKGVTDAGVKALVTRAGPPLEHFKCSSHCVTDAVVPLLLSVFGEAAAESKRIELGNLRSLTYYSPSRGKLTLPWSPNPWAYVFAPDAKLADKDLLPLRTLRYLKTLELPGQPMLTDACGSFLPASLEELSVKETRVGEKFFACVAAQCPNLTSLDTSETGVTDTCVDQLCSGLTKMKSLSMSRTKVSDAACRSAAGLPMIKSIDVRHCENVTDDAAAVLCEVATLKQVKMVGSGATRVGTELLLGGICDVAIGSSVARINLAKSTVTDAQLAYLKKVPSNRTHLDLSHTATTGAGHCHIASMKALKVLSLAGTKASIVSMVNVAQLPLLVDLSLAGAKLISDTSLLCIASSNAETLKKLDLSRTSITNSGLAAVHKLVKLEELNLSGMRSIGDAGLAHVAKAAKLRVLLLAGTGITGCGLMALKDNLNLNELNLTNTKTCASPDDMAALKSIKWLRILVLARTKISNDGLAHIPQFVRTLDIRETAISCEGLQLLARHSPELRSVDASATKIGNDEHLLGCIRSMRRLKVVNISRTKVGRVGVQAMLGGDGADRNEDGELPFGWLLDELDMRNTSIELKDANEAEALALKLKVQRRKWMEEEAA